jgi:putative toxin-antitoxin system antitoxin component (TIGR02293 family)
LFNRDAEGARRWLSRPAKALGGLTPLEMTETEIGASEVQHLIGRLEDGVIT